MRRRPKQRFQQIGDARAKHGQQPRMSGPKLTASEITEPDPRAEIRSEMGGIDGSVNAVHARHHSALLNSCRIDGTDLERIESPESPCNRIPHDDEHQRVDDAAEPGKGMKSWRGRWRWEGPALEVRIAQDAR